VKFPRPSSEASGVGAGRKIEVVTVRVIRVVGFPSAGGNPPALAMDIRQAMEAKES